MPKFKTNEQGKRELDGAWLALTANVGLYDHINKADPTIDATYGTNHAFHCNYNCILNAYLPKEWNLSAFIWGMSPTIYNYERFQGGFVLGAGIQKSWEEKGLTLSLNAMDLARSLKFKSESYGMENGYIAQTTYTAFLQNISLGISWQFGQYLQHRHRNVGDDNDGRLSEGGKKKGL